MADDNQVFQDKTTGKFWKKTGNGYVSVPAPTVASKPAAQPFLSRLRSAAWERPGDIAQERPPVLDSGENPALGNVPGSTSGKFPLREGMSEASSLANAAMILQGNEGRGMPKTLKSVSGAAKDVGKGASVVGREIAGRGPSMEKLQVAKDINAQPLKVTLKSISNNARTDASRLLDTAVKTMDSTHPQGIVSKADFGPKVDSIIKDYVKIGSEKPPTPLPEMAETPDELSQASVFKGGGQALRGSGLSETLRGSGMTDYGRQRLNDFLGQIGEAPMQEQPVTAGQGISALELQQLRSKLFNAAYGPKGRTLGAMRTAAQDVYKLATNTLDNAAKESGERTPEAWKVGNERWKTYKDTFDGKWENGEFHESPIHKALSGQTADEIVEPLSKGKWVQTKKLLNQYGGRFGADLDSISKIVNRHDYLKGLETNPQAYFYAMAASGALSPLLGTTAYGMSGYGFYRVLMPVIRRLLATRGIDPDTVLKGYEPIEPGLPRRY